MKHTKSYIILLCTLLLLAGCSKNAESDKDNSYVSQPSQAETDSSLTSNDSADESVTNNSTENFSDEPSISASVADIDYDLITLDEHKVYDTLQQILLNPDDFIGKTIKIKGQYSSVYYSHMQQQYNYVVIADDDGCSQMLEFVWVDGSDSFPAQPPAEGSVIEVVGIFETYQDKGDPSVYCRLNTTSLKVVK